MTHVRYKNPTGSTIIADGIVDGPVPPGGEVYIPLAYCRPRQGQIEGKFLPPVIKQLAPQLVPVDQAEADALAAQPVVPSKTAPTAADFEAQGLAPGVAEIAAKQAADKMAKARAAKAAKAEAAE